MPYEGLHPISSHLHAQADDVLRVGLTRRPEAPGVQVPTGVPLASNLVSVLCVPMDVEPAFVNHPDFIQMAIDVLELLMANLVLGVSTSAELWRAAAEASVGRPRCTHAPRARPWPVGACRRLGPSRPMPQPP